MASSSGTPNITFQRGRSASAGSARTKVDILSTALTIDANRYDSKDAATPAVINTPQTMTWQQETTYT